MGSGWKKAKGMLGLNLCLGGSRTSEDESASVDLGFLGRRFSDVSLSSPPSRGTNTQVLSPTSPTPSSSGLRLSKSGSRSSKKACAICLGSLRPGHGHALFTAECSHTFHYHCITSNVKHGNQACPVCRAKWKDIPFHAPMSSQHHSRSRLNPVGWSRDDGHVRMVRQLSQASSPNQQRRQQRSLVPLFQASEPHVFDDDEAIDLQFTNAEHGPSKAVDIKMYPEFSAISQSNAEENFTILIQLKAPHCSMEVNLHANSIASQTSRAPIDLVTVLDVSGSMAGTKLALLKRAMGFVIQHLSPSDRLSVIAFSSTAHRLFHLRQMSESGRQQALQAVNSLAATGGTNIAEGLRMGAKVIEDRKIKNPVCSIILLSDGQDTYSLPSNVGGSSRPLLEYHALVPSSIHDGGRGHRIPVHAFGFGADHDSAAMHSISEVSGGTFSFIEAESVVQDAFAQCIGGLLSVVVQDMVVKLECKETGVCLGEIKSGSYASRVASDRRAGSIVVGDLYADEERDFLVSVNIPPAQNEMALIKVGCDYVDPVLKERVSLEGEEVKIERPNHVANRRMSIEVDRQRNRVQAAEAMEEARKAAERGALSDAVSILGDRRRTLLESLAGQSSDPLCMALDVELREMQERMRSRQQYEASGRAYVLSGLSSHSWQRATARGDSTESTSQILAYQTPSMVDMLHRSQILSPRQSPHIQQRISVSEQLPRR